MTDLKITGLTDLASSPASNDVLPIVDVSDTTMAPSGTNKKVSFSNFLLNYVAKALYDAHTILMAVSDNTPTALTIAEQTVVGRATGGNIAALAIDNDLSAVSGADDTIPSAKATKTALDGKSDTGHTHDHGTLTGLGDDDHTQYLLADGSRNLVKLDLTNSSELTIATGAITVTQSYHRVDTEADAPSDDLDTINGGADGMVLYLVAENDARTVVLKHNTGNIVTPDGANFSLDTDDKVAHLIYSSAISAWRLVGTTGTGGGATTALDNLASVAINTSLISDTDVTDNLGSAAKKWLQGFIRSLVFDESTAPSTPASGDLSLFAFHDGSSNSLGHVLRSINSDAQNNALLHGDISTGISRAVSTTPITLLNKVIKAGYMSSRGLIHSKAIALVLNNSGANRQYTITYNFGTYNISVTTGLQPASATNYLIMEMEVYTWNDTGTSAQFHEILFKLKTQSATGTFAALATNNYAWDSSSIATNSADTTVSITLSSSADTTTQLSKSIGLIEGPYNGPL